MIALARVVPLTEATWDQSFQLPPRREPDTTAESQFSQQSTIAVPAHLALLLYLYIQLIVCNKVYVLDPVLPRDGDVAPVRHQVNRFCDAEFRTLQELENLYHYGQENEYA